MTTDDTEFTFRALRADGVVETGVVDAHDRAAAAELLSERGVFPVELEEASGHSLSRVSRISAQDRAVGLRAMATLVESGLTVHRTVSVMESLAPPSWTPALPEMRARVERGEPLSRALAEVPLGLPAHVLGLIEAGEAGGGLSSALTAAAQSLEGRAQLVSSLKSAMAYPIMLAVAGSASVAFLVGVVLPRFVILLEDVGADLPTLTRAVLGFGTVVRVAWLPGGLCVAAVVIAWLGWVRDSAGRRRWHTLLLSAPAVGPVRFSTGSSNGCGAMGALLAAGVPVAAAMPLAARATGDAELEERWCAARELIRVGRGVGEAMGETCAITPTALRLVRVGEESGTLATMFASASRIEAQDARRRVERLTRFIEPALVLAFGIMVMGVAAALLQAMYSLRPVP